LGGRPSSSAYIIESLERRLVLSATPVSIPDANLEAAIRAALNKPADTITSDDMLSLTELQATNDGIVELTGLESAVNLQILNIPYNQKIADISALAGLTSLQSLDMSLNKISNIGALAKLTNLRYLTAYSNQIKDISPLAGLTKLESLIISENRISDIHPLAGLTKMHQLWLRTNEIGDIAPLAGLSDLQLLFLDWNPISDLRPLSGLAKLGDLSISYTQVSDLSPLSGLTNLGSLSAGYDPIVDIRPLSEMTGLGVLYLAGDQISDLTPLVSLKNLGTAYLISNQISDVSPLAALPELSYLFLADNQISDITPLTEIPNLIRLQIDHNYLGVDTGSVAVDAVQHLEDRGVLVDYLPQKLHPGAAVVQGDLAANSFIVDVYFDTLQVFRNTDVNSVPIYVTPVASITSLTINGGVGDDTVTLDLSFLNPIPPGGFIFNGGGGNDTINIVDVYAAARESAAPFNGSITVRDGNFTFASDARGLSITASQGTVVSFATSQHLAALTLADSAKATLAAGGEHFIRTSALSIAPTATLDLVDNDLILQSTATNRSADLAVVAGLIKSGRNGGLWNGQGIANSTAAAEPNKLTGLAIALNDKGTGTPLYTTFDNESVDSNSILVKYTWNGDADLSGKIDADDYFQIDRGFASKLAGYRNGDFDFNDAVDADDYFLIDRAFLGQSGILAAEPSPRPSPAGRGSNSVRTTARARRGRHHRSGRGGTQ
jgi:Leucine-rich repeat (LRR) protein